MATGIIRNFHIQAPAPSYFPLIFQHSSYRQDEEEKLEEEPEDGEEREDDDEEEDDEESQEEEDECLDEVFPITAHPAVDVTKQLLRFAEHISRDVQRYFGRCSGEPETCDVYSDSSTVPTSGRLRYYDDLLRIARSGSPDEPEIETTPRTDNQEVIVAKGNRGLGPLAELFDHRGPSQNRGQPMIKRHLPLSFWSEPISCCSLATFSNSDITHTNNSSSTHTDTITHYNPLTHRNTHTIDGSQPDFSDLLANWDPNPELTHTHTDGEHTHMLHH